MRVSSGNMAVDEQKLRRSLHERLEAALGADEAALLMEYLPPVGWADVATKRDLDVLAKELRAEMKELGSEMKGLRNELRADISDLKSSLLMWLAPTVIGSVGIAVTLARVA